MNAFRRWGPCIAWGALILTATSLPGALFTGAPIIPGADKVVHATMYGVFAFLLGRAFAQPHRAAHIAGAPGHVALVLIGVALFAAADEWHQQFVPGRSTELADWLADMAGAAAGVTLSRTAPSRRGTFS